MIEFTIKTLDGEDHNFSVDDETTVEELKLLLHDQLGLDPHMQRLIFCGRVLQDDKRLDELDVDGKVMHLVQRPPPGPGERQLAPGTSGGRGPPGGAGAGGSGHSGAGGSGLGRGAGGSGASGGQGPGGLSAGSGSSSSNSSTPTDNSAATQDMIRRLMHQHQMNLSPTSSRLELIRTMIAEIRISLSNLRAHVNETTGLIPPPPPPCVAPVEPMDVEPIRDEIPGDDVPNEGNVAASVGDASAVDGAEGNDESASNDEGSTINDDESASNDDDSASNGDESVSYDEVPVRDTDGLVPDEDGRAGDDDVTASIDDGSTSTDDESASTDFLPARKDDGPAREHDGPARRDDGPEPKDDGPARKDDGPARKDHGPARRDDGPARKSDGPARKPDGPARKPDGPARKADGPARKPDGPARKDAGPARDTAGPARDTAGPARSTAGPARSTSGPARSTAGPARSTAGPARSTAGPVRNTAEQPARNVGSSSSLPPPNRRPAYDSHDDMPHLDDYGEDMNDPEVRAASVRRRALRAIRARRTSPRDLGSLVEELELLHMRFTPHRVMYINLLHAEYRSNPPRYNEFERQANQRTVDMISDIMHSFAHAYHAISDISFQVAHRVPRLSSDIMINRSPIPVQAHINVMHTRRPAPPPADVDVPIQHVMPMENDTPSAESGDSSAPPSEASVPLFTSSTAPPSVASSSDPATAIPPALRPPPPAQLPAQSPAQSPAQPPAHPTAPSSTATASASIAGLNAASASASASAYGAASTTASASASASATATASATASAGISDCSAACTPPIDPQRSNRVTTSQPTVNISIQPNNASPSRSTYHVEIGTRMPIPNAVEGTTINNLNVVNVGQFCNQQQQQGPPGQTQQQVQSQSQEGSAPRAQAQPGQAQSGQAQSGQAQSGQAQSGQAQSGQAQSGQAQSGQIQQGQGQQGQRGTEDQNQGNRRQVVIADLENLFRGVGQHGGVEVVLSMEEISQVGALGNLANLATNAALNNQGGDGQPLLGAEIYLAQVPFGGGAPGADLLHNIVSAVVRQGIGSPVLPAMSGLALRGIIPMRVNGNLSTSGNGQSSNAQNNSRQTPEGGPQQTDAPGQRPGGTPQADASGLRPSGAPQAREGQNEPASGLNNANQPRLPNVQVRRITTAGRGHPVLFNNVYDRFLPCENAHARIWLQRRRDDTQREAAMLARFRADRDLALRFMYIRERGSTLLEEDMPIIERLLVARHSTPGWINAFLCAVARNLFASDMMQPHGEEDPVVPDEFPSVQNQLRNCLHHLLVISGSEDNENANAFENISNYLVAANNDFISRIPVLADVRLEVDVAQSIRSFLRARMPTIMANVMSEASHDVAAPRLCAMLGRLFTDFLSLILRCCADGDDGLRIVYNAYIEDITESEDEVVMEFLRRFFIDVFMKVRRTLFDNMDNIRNYIIHHSDSVIRRRRTLIAQRAVAPEPMNMTPPATPQPMPPLARPVARHPTTVNAETMTDPIVICSASPSSPPVTAGIFRSSVVHGAFGVHGQHCGVQQQNAQCQTMPQQPRQPRRPQLPLQPQQPQQRIHEPPILMRPHQQTIQTHQLHQQVSAHRRRHQLQPQQLSMQLHQQLQLLPQPQRQQLQQQLQILQQLQLHGHEDQIHLHFPNSPYIGPGLSYNQAINYSRLMNQHGLEITTTLGPDASGAGSMPGFDELPLAGLALAQGNAAQQTPQGASGPTPPRTSRPTKTESPSRSEPESPTNVRLVPPMLIVQHWGDEWVPVLTNDQSVQREEQPPYSDAYLSGMPSRKRRCIRQARPPTTLLGFINESFGEARVAEGSVEEATVLTAFREYVRTLARTRAALSEDFEPERYTATAQFLESDNTDASHEGAGR